MDNQKLIEKLKEFIESEARSCSMDPGCITPEYVYRMWGGGINEDDWLSSPQMTSQQSTDARQIHSSRSGSRQLREGRFYTLEDIKEGFKELQKQGIPVVVK